MHGLGVRPCKGKSYKLSAPQVLRCIGGRNVAVAKEASKEEALM